MYAHCRVFIPVSIGTRSVKIRQESRKLQPKISSSFLWPTLHIIRNCLHFAALPSHQTVQLSKNSRVNVGLTANYIIYRVRQKVFLVVLNFLNSRSEFNSEINFIQLLVLGLRVHTSLKTAKRYLIFCYCCKVTNFFARQHCDFAHSKALYCNEYCILKMGMYVTSE